MILYQCASCWNNKKRFDIIDARCKHEDFYEMLQPEHDDPRKSSYLQRTAASSEPPQAKNGVWHGDILSLLVGVATTIMRNVLLYIKLRR